LKIRPLTLGDEKKILALFESVALFSKEEQEVLRELLSVQLADLRQEKSTSEYNFIVTEEDQGTDGGVLSSFLCYGATPMTSGTYDLYWIGTGTRYERQGKAQSLLLHLMTVLKEQQGRLVRIETSGKEAYEGTVRFYQKMRFFEEARIKDFYSEGDDLIVYFARL
jgi:ribosomal protein S18 acetylase RimI-like enzyme